MIIMSYELYDVFTKQDVFIADGEIMNKCRELGIDNTALAKLVKSSKKLGITVGNRYILKKNKDKIFTLVEFETGKEYDCINNDSLFIQLGIEQKNISSNETKYIYELKRGRQALASICGKIFSLKGAPKKVKRFTKLKATSAKYEERLKLQRLKYRLISRIRTRIYNAITYKIKTNTKKDRTLKLLSCSISFYMEYLSTKFLPGMSWGNYGLWEIDHIVPCASFELLTLEEQQKCFHYSNTQPLWAEENGSKNDKSPEEWEIYKDEKLKRQEIIQKTSSFSYALAP